MRAAVRGGHDEIVHLLLDPQHRLPVTRPEYFRAILAGVQAGRADLINLLFFTMGRRIPDYPHLANQMLMEASKFDQEDIVTLLLDNGTDVNAWQTFPGARDSHDPLACAVSRGNLSLVRLLLKAGAEVGPGSAREISPIEAAADTGHETIVDLLLDLGASAKEELYTAVDACQHRVVLQVLARFPELPARWNWRVGKTALVLAILNRNPRIIRTLIDAGVPLNDYENFHDLPLYVAKSYKAKWIVDFLISIGAKDQDFGSIPSTLASCAEEDRYPQTQGGNVRIKQRTWEWVGG